MRTGDIAILTEDMIEDIKARAKQYVDDNYRYPTDYEYLSIENAMLIGAMVAMKGAE